ncbi:sodium/glutamate symporter [Pseudomonas sp. S36]|nr:sodium/glutamate symporter [Pseudomonas sp. S36]
MTDRDGCPNYSIREAFLSDLINLMVIKLCLGLPFFQ